MTGKNLKTVSEFNADFTIEGQWQWKKLALWHALAGILLLSSFFSPLQSLWIWVDEQFYFLVNGSVAAPGLWQELAAFSNTKLFDKLSTFLLAGILFAYMVLGPRSNFAARAAVTCFIGVYLLLMTWGRRELGLFEYDRHSPSMVLEPFNNLRETYPDMRPKVTSSNAFPSDHGIACIFFLALIWRYTGAKVAMAVLFLLPVFVFPRLIGGAHWLTDIVVGGGFYTMMVLSWAFYTPLGSKLPYALYRLLARLENRFITPVIKRFRS